MIHVDSREPDSLKELIRDDCEEVEVSGMDTADFLVRHYAIERKRFSDLVGRMKATENDLFLQLTELQAFCEEEDMTPVLLLEGNVEAQLSRTEISVKQVMGTLAGVYKMGITVWYSAGKKETSYILGKMELESTESGPRAIRDTPSVPEEKYPRYLTEGFDKVGPKTASRILARFGNYQKVVNADVEELKEVHGVGTKTAEHIHEVVRRDWEEEVDVD